MYEPQTGTFARGSFREAVVPPTTASSDSPLVCLSVNADWLPYIEGALQQLALPSTWIVADDTALWDILSRVQDLIGQWGNSEVCRQMGTQEIIIESGTATATHVVTLPEPFSVAPVAVVSESTGLYIASVDSTTETTVTLRLTASVPVIVDSAATVSWIAGVPS